MTLGSGGSLGTILLILAWVLAGVMALCFLGAVAAFRYVRRNPDRTEGGEARTGAASGVEVGPVPGKPAESHDVSAEDAPDRLGDADPLVRVAAIAALKGRADLEGRLLEALSDEYPLVRREAVRALGEIGSARATRALIEVAGHDLSAEVREEAVAALGALLRERRSSES